jgi:hypothetical protein
MLISRCCDALLKNLSVEFNIYFNKACPSAARLERKYFYWDKFWLAWYINKPPKFRILHLSTSHNIWTPGPETQSKVILTSEDFLERCPFLALINLCKKLRYQQDPSRWKPRGYSGVWGGENVGLADSSMYMHIRPRKVNWRHWNLIISLRKGMTRIALTRESY